MTNPPLPRDVQDFQFKLASRLKVYDRKEESGSGPVNLLAVSSKLGLVFVAAPVHLQIFETSVLLANTGSKGVGVDIDIFPRYCINLPSRPSHIGISCDHLHVAVVLSPEDKNQYPTALIYVISSLISKNTAPAWEVRLGAVPGVAVRDVAWNPRLPQLICVCLCDGSVSVNELKGSSQTVESISLPASTGAKCISWSPKGKQLVIGTVQGAIIQYKPDLKQVKVISPPAGFAPISLLWLSSFQFAVVYGSPMDNANGASRPGLHIVNAPKGESESHLNYDDICYSCGELRPPQYYLSHIPKWNVLLMSSANSMEVGVLASDGGTGGEPLVWEPWTLEDASRAELPLSPSREEMYAIGMAVDTSPTAHLPWGENQSIPPAPLLLVLSSHGLLCSFNIINLRPGAAQDLCSPPEGVPGIQEVLSPMGPPPSALTMTTPPSSFGAPPMQNQAVAFPAISNAFLPNPPPSFSASTTIPSFAPLPPSAMPSSPFGSQTVKADVGKGWLSGSPGSSPFGFGALGTSAASSKDAPLSSSGGQSFLFSVPSANAFPTVTAPALPAPQMAAPPTVLPLQQQPAFHFALQTTPTPSHQPAHIVPTQRASHEQLQGLFGAVPSTIGPSKAATESSKPVIGLTGDSHAVGKIKFGASSEIPEGGGSSNVAEIRKEDPQRLLGPPEVLVEVPKTVPEVQVTIQTPVQQPSAAPVVTAVSNAAIFSAIVQETALFEKELMHLKMRHQKFNIVIGTSDEKRKLRVEVDAMENFLGELSEETQVHTTAEINALRTLLMEAFAWVEEARSRHLYSKNPRYLHLAMEQELDPVIKEHIVAIRNRVHYLDTQLQQMDSSLDNQWGTFMDACNKKKRKQQKWAAIDSMQLDKREIHMPSLEFVYQTILSQQQILEKHRARLDELEMKVRNRANWDLNGNSFASLAGFQTQSKRGSNRERSGEQDLSSMAESLLALQLGESKFEGRIMEQLGNKNPLVPKKMSPRHVSQLCNLLAHKPMTRVIPSPRGISSLNVLPMKLTDTKSLVPNEDDPAAQRIGSIPTASPSGKSPKATSTPVKKEVATSKENVNAASLPNVQTSVTALKLSSVPGFGFGTRPVSHLPPVSSTLGCSESGSILLDSTARQSKNLAARSEAAGSSPSAVVGFTMSPVSVTTTTNVKSSTVPAKAIFVKGYPSSTTSISSLSSSTSYGTTKSVSPQQIPQPSSIFSGTGSPVISASPQESSSWAFSTSGSFSIGSSSKPGGISSGKPVVPPVAPSLNAPTTTMPTSTTPAFSLNLSATSKPSFSLTPKPANQPSFSLPVPVFGSQGGSTSLSSSKEPLFVFGGSAVGATVILPTSKPLAEENAASDKNSIAKEKENKQKLEDSKPEKISSSGVELVHDDKEKIKQALPEKLPTTFSFGSAFGQTVVPLRKTTLTDTAHVIATTTTTTNTSVPSPALVQAPIFEDITPENKVECNTVKEKPQEKTTATRSLFTDFSFKLSEGECEAFGTKPLAPFGAPGSPAPPPSTPASTPIFGIPTSVAPSPQLLATVAPTDTLSTSLPIISQSEPSTTTPITTNPLSSLGTIVANLGNSGNTFGKLTSDATKPVETSTFSSFSFALPTKDGVTKPLPSETAAELPPADGQKVTPVKGLPSASPPEATSPSSQQVAATSSSSTTSDFGQGLANILGQSLPISSSSPSQQQQPAQNPFAAGGSGSVFGSSSGSSPNTAILFGKPSEGSPAIGLFGQPLKQDAATASFFGSSSTATPPSTSVTTFGSSSMFVQPTSSSASVFGSSGFGSKPIFGQSMSTHSGTAFSLGGSVFGQSAGPVSSASSVFGSPSTPATAGGNMFQTPATSSTGTFGSSGASIFGSVAQAGFGSPTSSFQAKPGGFGGSPVFGAMASGGSSPSFGGAATFGSPPAFGSHVFGASVSTAGSGNIFGSGGTSPPSTFENLATAPTLTFGNLAQSGQSTASPFGASQSQTPAAFGSAGSASSTGGSASFGGSSFTSWR